MESNPYQQTRFVVGFNMESDLYKQTTRPAVGSNMESDLYKQTIGL